MEKSKKVLSLVSALMIAAGAAVPGYAGRGADTVSAAGGPVMEHLNRGISAIGTGSGMLVSWRLNADDDVNSEFRLYRDDTLVYTSGAGKATCYLDKDGKSSSKYRVDTVSGGRVVSSEDCKIKSDKNYISIPLSKPTGSGCTYSPNDCSVGDVDGDGQYEIFLKWDPSNSKDNSQSGDTGNVFIDCYTLEGKRLWRVDLGRNIRAGQHYTQFLVADFDGDGRAEMTCKTADGTVDGTGKVIGDKSKNYRNSSGYVLDGPEYYTLFDGATGKALDTVNYAFPRGKVSDWGDNYGNRVDRFLGAVCYFEEGHPTAVSVRGYYTRMTLVAYDVKDKKLVERWKYDSGNDKAKGYSGGNHNCMPADVDGDGLQELFLGATCIDHTGKLLWANGRGHGDAMHIGDLDPDRNGLEAWVCHEEKGNYGVTLLEGETGKAIFHKDASADTGRCCGDNVYAGNRGAELWGAESGNVYNLKGTSIGTKKPAQSFLIYWDGDLEREILDGTKITKFKSPTDIAGLLTADGCTSVNGSKSNPSLAADIFGDWREEAVWPASDGNSLRIYGTNYTTDVRMTTLMHEPQYRNQVAGEQTCYNQPAHTAFYLGSELKSIPKAAVQVRGSSVPSEPVVTEPVVTEPVKPVEPIEGAQKIEDGKTYLIKNVNSGLYLDIEGGAAVNAANVYQASGSSVRPSMTWKAVAAGDGYYYLASGAGDGTIVLDVNAKKADNGTNIQLYNLKNGDNQQFKFEPNADGSYRIVTKISGGTSCIEVMDALKDEGANVQEWELNGFNCQDWVLESAAESVPAVTTVTTAAAPPETTAMQVAGTTLPVTAVPSPEITIPVTTAEVIVTTPAVSEILSGDYNADGIVDITDLSFLSAALVDHIALPADVAERMDVTHDGEISLTDLAKLKQFLTKIIDKL